MKNIRIPEKITVNGEKFVLSEKGTKEKVQRHKEDLIHFNQKQRIEAGESWRTIYKYRVKNFNGVHAVYIR